MSRSGPVIVVCAIAGAVILLIAATYILAPDFYWSAVKGLHDYGDAVSALGTLVVALFTFTLWWSTDKLWRAGERALQVTERAFVYIEGFTPEMTLWNDNPTNRERLPENGWDPALYVTRFAVQPRWSNSGSTPTRNMVIEVNWKQFAGTLPLDFAYEYKGYVTPMFVGPHAIVASETVEMPGVNASIRNGMGDGPIFYIWGRAGYDDVFDKRHFIKWCYSVRFHRFDSGRLQVSFVQHGEYNGTDGDT